MSEPTTLPLITGTAADRPRLYCVPPEGLTLSERAEQRRENCGVRSTWAYRGYDEETPDRCAFSVGIAYGVWGVDPKVADRMASLAYHLISHTMEVVHTHRYIVTAALVDEQATVSVLALDGRIVAETDPASHPEIGRAATLWGTLRLEAGPCLYAGASV
ncbi:hypothetical protein [Streptomyces sp. CB03238]|uniref:hypothetical protein n=1 Tax=Streptomyces sp. CB03238 TaxID=1907777 RepID=UPI000A108F44|nr:hypothetical protein [Streptomyces sp. CB03238]ORT54212.1 hypothetical protein BKD26_36080 [Streptomyces sp. CB03238]